MSHTHTHATGEICPLPLTHPSCLSSRATRSSGQPLWRPGTKPSAHVQSWSGTGERSVLLHVFMLGFFVEETLVNTGRTCKLHTERPGRHTPEHWRPGENLPPRTNSAPCGNRTQDLLAVKRQCKHLSHLNKRPILIQTSK